MTTTWVGHSRAVRGPGALALVAAIALACAATSATAQYGNYRQPYHGQGYGQDYGYGQQYGQGHGYQDPYYRGRPRKPGLLDRLFGRNPFNRGPQGNEGLGRTLGGAAGLAAGSIGGAVIASSVIKAAGVAALGPIAPILLGTAITAGAAFVGSKLGSHGGVWMDQALGPDMTWTMVGTIAGSLLGFTLLPALGPFAGPAGRVVGAAVGGLAGGILGKLFAPQLQRFATPKVIYGATGALVGGVGFGIPGALIGAVGGYALGTIFDRNFFATPGTTTRQDLRHNVFDERGISNTLRNGGRDIGNWVRDSGDWMSRRLRTPSDREYIGYGNPYIGGGGNYGGDYYGGGYYPNQPASGGQPTGTLEELDRQYREALARFQNLEGSGGSEAQRQAAYADLNRKAAALRKAKEERR